MDGDLRPQEAAFDIGAETVRERRTQKNGAGSLPRGGVNLPQFSPRVERVSNQNTRKMR